MFTSPVSSSASNSTYDSFDLARTVIKMRMDNSSAERQSEPSPDVILGRLHQIKEEIARRKIEKLCEELLNYLHLKSQNPQNPNRRNLSSLRRGEVF